eukprot:1754672-Pleurochrysis_carterae.AAC.1
MQSDLAVRRYSLVSVYYPRVVSELCILHFTPPCYLLLFLPTSLSLSFAPGLAPSSLFLACVYARGCSCICVLRLSLLVSERVLLRQ